MNDERESGDSRPRKIVLECVRRVLAPSKEMPGEDEELVESGILDSMAWVEIIECLEKASRIAEFSDPLNSGQPRTIRSLIAALARQWVEERGPYAELPHQSSFPDRREFAALHGWGIALGSVRVDATVLEREFALSRGTLRDRAGIESVARAGAGEDEASLAQRAAELALRKAGTESRELDWIIASSDSFVGFPSLSTVLHSSLLARDDCAALDVGGACVGLLNGLAVAGCMLGSKQARNILIVTADVHSRHLGPGCVAGEFGGLFGDGASAFVLRRVDGMENGERYRVGDFAFGCSGTFASALAIHMSSNGRVELEFDGELLARAALGRLERIIADLELRTGFDRSRVGSLAVHQPNPRLIEILARQARVPLEKFPMVSRRYGNLGSSTCGVALAMALEQNGHLKAGDRRPIFLAAVGPGMLWGGGFLH
jgi:3-oxoacyl-[acyl-carrier-protein] synthase-3